MPVKRASVLRGTLSISRYPERYYVPFSRSTYRLDKRPVTCMHNALRLIRSVVLDHCRSDAITAGLGAHSAADRLGIAAERLAAGCEDAPNRRVAVDAADELHRGRAGRGGGD